MLASELERVRPAVSVIVPARNEEVCLGACLQSLVSQTEIDFEVIVVDDHSTDRTRQIAASFPTVHVIDAPSLPQGWTGKNNAMAAGAQTARGDWLLFTDADTVHSPGSLARAVAEVRQHKADLLSYSPQQEVGSFWEKAVMPVIFADLASTYPPQLVCDPGSPLAAANGQYLLISRLAYDAVGGHATIAETLLEDVALARAVKHSGRRIRFRYGADAVRTRMYRGFAQLQEGWTKNLARLFPAPRRLAALRLLEFLLIAGSLASALRAALHRNLPASAGAAVLAALLWAMFFRRIRRAHFSWTANLLSFAGLPVFAYLLLRSELSYKRGAVSWKGRSYVPGLRSAAAAQPESSLGSGGHRRRSLIQIAPEVSCRQDAGASGYTWFI